MNPEPITQTSAGMETPTQTVERVKRVMKPISAETIGTTPTFVPPPAPTKDASLSRLESRFEPTVPAAETPVQEQPNLRQSLVERQLAALEKLGTRGTRTQEVMDEQQVLAKQKALDATDKDIATRERYYENRRRALEDQGGGLKVGLESEQNTLRRERARELADLYIIRAGQQQDVETARQYANDLIDAEFEPLKEELEYSGKIYQMLANDLTDSEKIQVQQQLTEKNNNTEFVRNTASQVYNELINSGAYTPERGRLLKEAMAEASTAIQNGQSPEGAIAKMQGALQGVVTTGQQEMALKRADVSQGWEALNIRKQELQLSRERMEAEMTASGNTYGTFDGKPQTATQALVNGYANRLLEAEAVFSAVADQFASPTAFGGILPSIAQSEERQQYEQAKRNFVNAVLRRESGAVISDQEFSNAEKQYFPQAGDKPETVLQKERNRNTVINNFYKEANVPRPVFSGDIIESDGKKYQVAEDGVTLIEL